MVCMVRNAVSDRQEKLKICCQVNHKGGNFKTKPVQQSKGKFKKKDRL